MKIGSLRSAIFAVSVAHWMVLSISQSSVCVCPYMEMKLEKYFLPGDLDHKRRSQLSEANSDVMGSTGSSGCGSGGGGGANSGGGAPVVGGVTPGTRDSNVCENLMTSPETYKLACTLQELLNSEEKYIKVCNNQ